MKNKDQAKCSCSFCDDELVLNCAEPEFCEPCNVEFIKCVKCGQDYSKKLVKCPKCSGGNKII